MSSVVISGDTSGTVTLSAPATAGSVVITLPTTSGTMATTASISPAFDAGTVMLFVQTAAPTGWTKSVANNDKALRVVSGAAGTGGSVAFTTAFASQAVAGTNAASGATTLTTAQIAAHTHTGAAAANQGTGAAGGGGVYWASSSSTGSTGGGGSHTHTAGAFTGTAINLAVAYVDVIVATKN